MSFWSKLFGSSDAVKEGIGMLKDAGDALWYTDEEKARDKAAEVSEARQMILGWMATTTGQNLARRLLAVMITCVWLVQYLAMMILQLVAVWVDNPEQWNKSAVVIGDYAQNMNGAMMLILAFYFAAPHMGSIVESALNKFGQIKKPQ